MSVIIIHYLCCTIELQALQPANLIPSDKLCKEVKGGEEKKCCLKSDKEIGPDLGIYRILCHLLLITSILRLVLFN